MPVGWAIGRLVFLGNGLERTGESVSTLPLRHNQIKFSSPALRAKVERGALIGYLVLECLSLHDASAQDIEKHHSLTSLDLERRHLRSIPSDSENMVLSHECLNRFGADVLARSGLFYSFKRTRSTCYCSELFNLCICDRSTWRLDLNPMLAHRGVLLPLRDSQYGFFNDVLVFRHVRDEKPFPLKVGATV